MKSIICSYFFSVLVLSFLSSAQGIALPFSPPNTSNEKRDDTCGFVGNSDLYGLGIRLGIYCQWVSAFIVWGWYKEGGRELVGAYCTFIFATLIAMVVATVQAQPVYVVEIYLLTYIIFGGTFVVGFATATVPQINFAPGGSVRLIFSGKDWVSTMMDVAGGVYCAWFWIYGYRHDFLETPCGTFGFLFAKVSLYNTHITSFFAALSIWIVVGAGYLLTLGVSIIALPKDGSRWRGEAEIFTRCLGQLLHLIPSPFKGVFRSPRGQKLLAVIILQTTLIYSIIAMELTISWNSISDVYTIRTTGQLIPLIIGLSGLLQIIYKLVTRKKGRKLDRSSNHSNELELAAERDNTWDPVQSSSRNETHESDQRLAYLDLSRPVKRSTDHAFRRYGLRRRDEPA